MRSRFRALLAVVTVQTGKARPVWPAPQATWNSTCSTHTETYIHVNKSEIFINMCMYVFT